MIQSKIPGPPHFCWILLFIVLAKVKKLSACFSILLISVELGIKNKKTKAW